MMPSIFWDSKKTAYTKGFSQKIKKIKKLCTQVLTSYVKCGNIIMYCANAQRTFKIL